MSQRIEVELDDTTAAYFERQGCVRCADMAAAASAASAALRELAPRAEVDALAAFLGAHPDYVAASDDEYHAALAELPAGGLYLRSPCGEARSGPTSPSYPDQASRSSG
jgi:hypothetical protein